MASLFRRTGAGRTGAWLAKFKSADGRYVVRSTRTTDKAAAARIASKWEAESRLRLEGVILPEVEAETKAQAESVEALLKAYEAKLKAAGRSAVHVRLTLLRLRRIADFCGWKSARDIKADGLNLYSIDARAKRSAQSIHHEVTCAKSFSGWLTKLGKLKTDPLRVVEKPSPATDRRYIRRMLLPEEFAWMAMALSQGGELYGMTARARGLLYRMGIETGLRAGELRSLKVGSLSLDSDNPVVVLAAGQTKNRKGARQSISAGLAAELRDFIANAEPEQPLFALPKRWRMVNMIRADLEAARALWLADADCPEERTTRAQSDFLKVENSAGQIFDFHSLRHSTGSWLARAGVSVPTIQRVMRHSTPVLTLGTYGHAFAGELQEAATTVGALVGVSLRPVGRLLESGRVTIGATKVALESALEAPAIEPALRCGHFKNCQKNGGSAWESNPPAPCFPCGSTVLKTAPGTSPSSASELIAGAHL
jgi:integrase